MPLVVILDTLVTGSSATRSQFGPMIMVSTECVEEFGNGRRIDMTLCLIGPPQKVDPQCPLPRRCHLVNRLLNEFCAVVRGRIVRRSLRFRSECLVLPSHGGSKVGVRRLLQRLGFDCVEQRFIDHERHELHEFGDHFLQRFIE